jgi:NitT/TauT family transport system ATP-binding protein
VLGRAGEPLRAALDVPEPRSDHRRDDLRAEIIAALNHAEAQAA